MSRYLYLFSAGDRCAWGGRGESLPHPRLPGLFYEPAHGGDRSIVVIGISAKEDLESSRLGLRTGHGFAPGWAFGTSRPSSFPACHIFSCLF
jgi:hypothetical protein